jgi:hypothetical protein
MSLLIGVINVHLVIICIIIWKERLLLEPISIVALFATNQLIQSKDTFLNGICYNLKYKITLRIQYWILDVMLCVFIL